MSPISRAQGTIEYLVTVAVIVVISLVVVGLVANQTDSFQGVSSTAGKLGSSSGSISISEAVIDSSGDGLISFSNNSGGLLTIISISVGGVDVNYDDVSLFQGETKTFALSDLGSGCSCAGFEGKTKTCDVAVYAESEYGLDQQFNTTVSVNCVSNATPVNLSTVIQPVSGSSQELGLIYSIVLDVKNSLDNLPLTDFNVNCDGTAYDSTDQNSPLIIDMNSGSYSCIFSKTEYDSNTVTIVADSNKTSTIYLALQLDYIHLSDCNGLQDMNSNLDANYILDNDIDCSLTTTWNNGSGFYPIMASAYCVDGSCVNSSTCVAQPGGCGSTWNVSYCEDALCTNSASCENPIGCGASWVDVGWCNIIVCANSASCTAPVTGCEGTWVDDEFGGYCSSPQLVCYDQETCEAPITGCNSTWNSNFTCNDWSGRCTNQESCERALGCGSTWHQLDNCTDPSCTNQSDCERITNGCGSRWMDRFFGSLNGNGYSISNFFINRPDTSNVGLFAAVGGTISHLNFVDADINGLDRVGALAGTSYSYVTDVNVSGLVSGNSYVGSIIGYHQGGGGAYLTQAHSTANVTGSSNVGGLLGQLGYSTTLSYSTSSGNVIGSGNVGGLVGYNSGATLTRSSSSSFVRGNGTVGGAVGMFNTGTISYCSATGNVTGGDSVGGLVGNSQNYGGISYSFAEGDVNGSTSVGGLLGYGNWISSCYASGLVNGETSVGGLVGAGSQTQPGTIANSYSTSNVTGTTSVGGLFGSTTAGVITLSNDFFAGTLTGTTKVGGLIGSNDPPWWSHGQTAINNTYWNDYGIDLNCVGYGEATSGTGCTIVDNNISYFKGNVYPDNAPMSDWNFSGVWEEVISPDSFPKLEWEN